LDILHKGFLNWKCKTGKNQEFHGLAHNGTLFKWGSMIVVINEIRNHNSNIIALYEERMPGNGIIE